MRLVLDVASSLQGSSRFRGIGRYARGLISGLLSTAGDNEVWLACAEDHSETLDEIIREFGPVVGRDRIRSYKVFPDTSHRRYDLDFKRRVSEALREHFLASLCPDVVIVLSMFEGYHEDLVTSAKSVFPHVYYAVIAYDLIPFLNQDAYLGVEDARRWYFDKLEHFKRCDHFLAISESARREVQDCLGMHPSRTTAIMTAADDFKLLADRFAEQGNPYDDKWRGQGPYYVYAASYEARKNFQNLIVAYGKVCRSISNPPDLVLVTSSRSEILGDIFANCSANGVDPLRVKVTGHVSDDELAAIYKNCLCMVYVSSHEGFGLPILEAMHVGAPVISSNASSMPEIVRESYAMFDPGVPSEIAQMMLSVHADQAFRSSLAANSTVQRERFSWSKTAESVWGAVKGLVSGPNDSSTFPSSNELYAKLITVIRAYISEYAVTDEDLVRSIANYIDFNVEAAGAAKVNCDLSEGWLIEGPFDSTYSLSLLNREISRALKALGEVVHLYSTEGPGDFEPNLQFMADHHPDLIPEIVTRSARNKLNGRAVVSRNLYPPRVSDIDGAVSSMHSYAWEESRFPVEWVEAFNRHLDIVTCLSKHVQKVLEDNGVVVPMSVSGCGVDHWERIAVKRRSRPSGAPFRFLHVSSCFPRKGPDVLVEAFARAFGREDKVELVIKTFRNPHNEIEKILEAVARRYPDMCKVEILYGDLSDSELKQIYLSSDALVAPSRAEGFGLPIAEAMLCGLPVIVTGWSGQLDFCNADNSWLVDFRFAPAETHFEIDGSVWADPDVDDLSAKMREVAKASKSERDQKTRLARKQLLTRHTWANVADRLVRFRDFAWQRSRSNSPTVGWVTTWNSRCGVATYSSHLISNIPQDVRIFAPLNEELIVPDGANVTRCWSKGVYDDLEMLSYEVEKQNIDCLVIQFNYAFFQLDLLSEFILKHVAKGRSIFIELHSTVDAPRDGKLLMQLTGGLKASARVIVHNLNDLNRLKYLGIFENTLILPHGIVSGYDTSFAAPLAGRPFTIATFGFCLPHKGLMEVLDAFIELADRDPELRLVMLNAAYPDVVSEQLIHDLAVRRNGSRHASRIHLEHGFMSDEASLAALRRCDLLVFNYGDTGESASGAVRFALASGRPTATNSSRIFEDVRKLTFSLEEGRRGLVEGLLSVIASLKTCDSRSSGIAAEMVKWRNQHSYETVARRLISMILAVHQNSRVHL